MRSKDKNKKLNVNSVNEKVVKNLVGKGVADKSEMPDGFTETCNLSLLEDIIKIYEEYGGMRVQW